MLFRSHVMKKLIVVIACLFSIKSLASAEKPVKSDISKVTVFTQGAQVFRSASVTLSPGTTQLVFSGISSKIKSSSIQAGGRGSFVVSDVQYRIQYPEPPKTDGTELPKEIVKEITLLDDSLIDLGFRRDNITERINALQLEKDMILKNKLARSEGKSDSLPVLQQAMEFFHNHYS